MDISRTLEIGCRSRLPPDGDQFGGDLRPSIELIIHRFLKDKQKVTALVNTGTEYVASLRSFLVPLVPSVVTEGTQLP